MSKVFELQETNPQATVLENVDLTNCGETLNRGCLDGYCGDCKCKLISGTVEYQQEPIAFLQEGEILTCISNPTSKQMKLVQ